MDSNAEFARIGLPGFIDTGAMCPTCGEGPLNGYTGLKVDRVPPPSPERPPKAGDVTLCVACGELLEFYSDGNRLLVRRTTSEVLDQLPPVLGRRLRQIAHDYRMDWLEMGSPKGSRKGVRCRHLRE